jgi:hypothetical protein
MRAKWEALLSALLLLAGGVCAQESGGLRTNSTELTELTLDALMQVKVFSVAKHLQPWFGAPAAIYVITGEDLRRSGATSIPEALRLAWRPNQNWEFAIVGQHLGPTHSEQGLSFTVGAERVPASVYGQITGRY